MAMATRENGSRIYPLKRQKAPTLEATWGLHPYEKLCHACQLRDCQPGFRCIQKNAARKGGVDFKHAKFDGRFTWLAMTEIMIKAGYALLLGELIELYGLEDMVDEYPQLTYDDLLELTPHPEYLMLKRQPERRAIDEEIYLDAD